MRRRPAGLASALLLLALIAVGGAAAKTRVAIGVTSMIAVNPYTETNAIGYTTGCQTYGCLGTVDYKTGTYRGMLAASWDNPEPTIWVFHLRRDLSWQDGTPVTAADVVHAYWRTLNDPATNQKANLSQVKDVTARDDHTIVMETREPVATFLDFIFDRLIITSKSLYDRYGARIADRDHPVGFGPYRIVKIETGSSAVFEKVPSSPFAAKEAPDELIFRVMNEAEQRVTALLNGEIQIAQFVPPQLIERVKHSKTARLAIGDSIEANFLAMRPDTKPWDNKLLRQAVAYAIDRDAIVTSILGGYADRLDSAVGPGQFAYDPALEPRYRFDPDKARDLVKRSGYDGAPVALQTATGKYLNDKETSEAIVAMLRAVGINAQLRTPEFATFWSEAQRGKVPFYYMGRGSMSDPTAALSQYFETGVSQRVGYSNPEFDAVIAKSRATFDEDARKALLRQAMSIVQEDVPALFLWRIKLIYGIADNIDYMPSASTGIIGNEIRVRQ